MHIDVHVTHVYVTCCSGKKAIWPTVTSFAIMVNTSQSQSDRDPNSSINSTNISLQSNITNSDRFAK